MESSSSGDAAPSASLLDARSRRIVAETCGRRSELELRGAAAFTAVTQALIELRADTRVVDLSARAIAEELRHSEIYFSLGRAYGLSEGDPPRPAPIEVPRFPTVGADGERLLQVVGMCCINETMACAFLELCFSGAEVELARDAIREVLEDEIRHARIGWAYLGSADVGDAERRLVSRFLVPMLEIQWSSWREQIATLPPDDLAKHGCPSPVAIERAAAASLRNLVTPGFATAGVDVRRAEEWAGREAIGP
jgi:hypothetical protein